MDWACSFEGEIKEAHKFFVGESPCQMSTWKIKEMKR